MDLNTLLSDYNGSILLEPGTAEWGYIEQQWYLQVPADSLSPDTYKPSSSDDPFVKHLNFENFIRANFNALSKNNTLANNEKALFGAMLRAHACKNGLFCTNIRLRAVIEDEYMVVIPEDKNWKSFTVPDIPSRKEIATFVKKFGDSLIHMMVYVFCSRGHHWQDEFDSLYDKLMKACDIIKPSTWQLPTNKEIFRQILHCFGVRLPLEFTLWCKSNNRMANPIRLRFSPHAPIAGAAQITTLNATLKEMTTESWYGIFSKKYTAEIAAVHEEVERISQNPYAFHIASRIVTGGPKIDLSERAKKSFTVLSQFALGYIDHLGKKHSLSNQKVITKNSGGMKPVAEAFSKACDQLGRPSVEVDNMEDFFKQF